LLLFRARMATSSTKSTRKKNPWSRSTDEHEISLTVAQFALHCAEYRSNAELMIERSAALMRQDKQLRRYASKPQLSGWD